MGKTTQVIGMLSHLIENGDKGPFLIIVPASVIHNWEREFERFCPSISLALYYGSANERAEQRDEDFMRARMKLPVNVMLTTYNTASGNKDDSRFLRKKDFKLVVLDEGHMVKNMMSQRYKGLTDLKIPTRILTTGTPIQNSFLN